MPQDKLYLGCYLAWVAQSGTLSQKQPPCPPLMTFFPVTLLSCQDALAFALQKISSQMHPRPPRQMVRVLGSQSMLVLVYTFI